MDVDVHPGRTAITWAEWVASWRTLVGVTTITKLALAGGQALPWLRPLNESHLGIADGPANTDVGRPVAAHARLREPREAHLQKHARFFSGQQRWKIEVLLVHKSRSLRVFGTPLRAPQGSATPNALGDAVEIEVEIPTLTPPNANKKSC